MDFNGIVNFLEEWVLNKGITIGGETISYSIIALLGTGIFLTLRLGSDPGPAVRPRLRGDLGQYDDPNEPGDVSHFQALTTALSATVGIGNIAGVAIAIHFGGSRRALLDVGDGRPRHGDEVLGGRRPRVLPRGASGVDRGRKKWEGTVSGGPMYYIEKGLGRQWKPLAIFFAVCLAFSSFLAGNGDSGEHDRRRDACAVRRAPWVSGLVGRLIVGR